MNETPSLRMLFIVCHYLIPQLLCPYIWILQTGVSLAKKC